MLTVIPGILFTSCKKNDTVTPSSPPTTLQNLKVSGSFNWSTGNVVELKITGLPTTVPVKSTLMVSLPDGTNLFSRLHQMDENITIKLVVPNTAKELTLTFGTNTYPVVISGSQALFSFIPTIEE